MGAIPTTTITVALAIQRAAEEIDAQLSDATGPDERGFLIGALIAAGAHEAQQAARRAAEAAAKGAHEDAARHADAFEASQARVAAAAIRFLEHCEAERERHRLRRHQ